MPPPALGVLKSLFARSWEWWTGDGALDNCPLRHLTLATVRGQETGLDGPLISPSSGWPLTDAVWASLRQVSHAAQGLNEASFPEDTESDPAGTPWWSDADLSDDEDMLADEASGDGNGSGENGSGIALPDMLLSTIYFRALVNFTQSIDYNPRLDDANSEEFREVSEAVVDTLESEYYKIGGEQVVSVVFIKEIDGYTFVELDVGSEGNLDEGEIREVLYSVIESGSIASYITSTQGFQFRRLGAVAPEVRACTGEEFACTSGECIDKEFRCDRRPDCRDMSDEQNCADTAPPPQSAPVRSSGMRVPFTTSPRLITSKHLPVRHPLEQRPCRRDEAVCSNKQCIPRDYLCDGERDCLDGSDELSCGTPTPCEPNEFKCRNGHCALKLWRCDGDNDCVDGSDEVDCPTKGPDDTCSPDQFTCVSSRTCIPASYQCDEEADCPDRSDEVGCTPPQVITPPEESVQATPGQTVRFRCVAVGVPTPIITWRLNWGHIPANRRVSISSENGYGTLTIRDVKEADQGAYTCEAINARGMVFGIPDGVLSLMPRHGPCPEGHFHVEGTSRCLACFCFGITTACHGTSRYRDQIRLRFDTPDDFKGVNVTTPAQPGTLPLSSTQLQIDPTLQEFQLVDLSRRFLAHDSFWTLPSQFLGNKVDSYGGYLSFKVRYGLARGQSEPVQKSNVVIVGNGQKLIYRVQVPTQPSVVNQRQIHFIEENWQHESGAPVSRETLLLALQNLESILVQTVYDNKMASVGLSDIAMDTTTMELTSQGVAQGVEECRCPIGYSGLSCERCDARFERVREGPYLGTCSGCNCHGHSSSCDRAFGYCLNCQHNTEGPQCNKCKPGFFGDATRGNATACRSCPCPYTDSTRRFSDTCFLDTDGQATCDACAQGYTGRRCERWVPEALVEQGGCQEFMKCDERGSSDSTGGACRCKPNVAGRLCNECTSGAFYLSDQNPDGCLKCFCMGVSRQCTSSSWNREQVPPAGSTSPPPRAPPGSTSPAQRPPSEQGTMKFGAPNCPKFHGALGSCVLHTRQHQPQRPALSLGRPPPARGRAIPGGCGAPDNALHPASLSFSPAPPRPAPIPPFPPETPHSPAAAGSEATWPQPTLLRQLPATALCFPLPVNVGKGSPPARTSGRKRRDAAPAHSLVQAPAMSLGLGKGPAAGSRAPRLRAGRVEWAGARLLCVPPLPVSGGSLPSSPLSQWGLLLTPHYGDGVPGALPSSCTLGACAPGTPALTAPLLCLQSRSERTDIATLVIPSITAADSGVYLCIGTSPAGVGSARIEVVVLRASGMPPPIRIEASSSSIAEGQTLDLNCLVTGQAPATVTWYKRGGSLPARHQVSGSHLRISQVSAADSGEYVCRVSIGASSREASIPVTVQHSAGSPHAPPIHIESSSSAVTEGQSLDLNCLITGQSSATVMWYKRGGSLPDGHQVSGSHLRLVRVSVADSGEYVCRVSTGAGIQEASIIVTIYPSGEEPPVRIESSPSSIAEGQTLDLHCLVMGQALATVTWYKRGGSLPASRQVSGSHLRIPQVLAADSGEYVCRISTGTIVQEASVIVTVSSARSSYPSGVTPPVRIESSSSSVAEGQTLDLNCLVAGQVQPRVTWHKRGGSLPASHQVSGSRLRILQVSAADSGEYICRVSTGAITQETSLIVTIQGGAGSSYSVGVTPPVRIETSSASIAEGQTLDLNCMVAGQAQPRVTWYRRGDSLPASSQVSGSRLRIPQVSVADSGEYICRVSNGAGPLEASVIVTIPRSAGSSYPSGMAPPVRIESSSSSIAEGQTLDLNCLVAGQAQPRVTWYKRGGALPDSHQVSGSRLRIPQVSAADSGEYVCRVSTGAVTQEAALVITIEDSTGPSYSSGMVPPIRIESSSSSIAEGQTLDLNCLVAGQAPATVTWYKRGGSLLASHQVSGSRLRLLQVSAADSGEYVCRVSTSAGPREASITVSVPSGTSSSYRLQSPIISIEPHSTAVRQDEDATFKCRIHGGARPINITWKMAPKQQLQDNVKISPNGSVITISRARPSNQGAYRCVASNRYGVANSVVNLMVQGSPTVSVMPKGPVTVKAGKSISLDCLGMGDPRPLVRWSRLGMRQKMEHQKLLPLESQAVLQISAAKPEDAGTYICMAQNSIGSAQVQVEVSVEAAHGKPGAPEITVKPTLTVVAGETATLQCSAIGDPPPTIQWSKLRAPLPWQHRVVNNTLLIPRVAQQDSGQYICNASNAAGFTEAFITLDVETPPYATSLPEEVSVSAGEAVQLQCLAHGTPPLHYQWSKANGSLSSNAVLRESALHIRPTVPEDSGTYRCLVSNRVGSAETFAQVTLFGGGDAADPAVTPQTDVKGVGGTAEFTCSVTGDARARIEWFREDGELPASHSVRNGVLRIQNLDRGCQGVYTCRVSSPSGQAQDSARLVIQALPKVMINVRTSVQSVLVGAAVEFECLAIGDPKAHITWSKVGSRIRPEVVVSGGMVKIERVEQSDAGQYRCTATNDVGTVQSNVILHVQSIPQIAAQPEVKEVTMGSRAVFPCLASGFPVPEIKWTKLEGDLPKDICLENNVLTIPSVKPEDAGIYVCTASNRQGKVTTFSMLKVRERVVPYFTQNPQTFLALPTIKDAYKKFEIQITFRPDTADGMLLYNGQKKSTGADFVSFGLVGGRPEFRFDAGSGMATIRHPAPIRLGEFHTVRLYRNLTQGSLVLDSHPPVNGTSQGKFQGLDLNEELYLGGYPDYIAVAKSGLSSGFVGCVRQLLVQGEEVIFKDLDLKAHGVSNCPTCRDRPCQNGGVCRDSESSSYVCHCPQEFTGSNCEHSQALHCHPEACGPDATCINRADGQGYRCRCHLGKSGETCMEGVMATTPSFSGSDSFISYPPLTNIHYELRLEAEFKPLSPDGLILFSGGSGAPVEDFVSLAVASGHVEFRYELGSGMAVLRSTEPLALGQWHKVSAERINKDGTLQVDSSKPVKRSSPGKSQGLNLRTPMYLGGVDKSITLPAAASISSSFHGCIGEVSINGKKVDISYSFLESRGITQCYDSSPCDRRPCLHGATCMPTGEYEFQCLCQDGFRGGRCELAEDQCLLRNPCLNGGKCKANKCLCPAGFSGTYCMGRGGSQHPLLSDPSSRPADAPGQYGAYFQDGGYLALPRHVLPRSRSLRSYQLGSGEASIVSEDPINDGEWHRVTAVREGRRGSIQVDGEELVSGESPGSNVMVNTQGNVYIGKAGLAPWGPAGRGRPGCVGLGRPGSMWWWGLGLSPAPCLLAGPSSPGT
uniref:Heparan sulfate proteoglycan 2 n=1 Tax=Terrapene triunguis TaxID=2587831 RepID=A0A674KFP3_9SAUR